MKSKIMLLGFVAALVAVADTTITEKAPDGVNIVTRTVDDDGNVVSQTSTLVNVPDRIESRTTVYSWNLKREVI